ncbi:hemin uptake protein HemP [Thermomonas brevis]
MIIINGAYPLRASIMSATTLLEPSFRPAPRAQGASASAQSAATPALESRQLLQGRCEVLIRHGDEVYRLRHTRNDKLILTK